jgi:hypothetical protein
MIDAAIGKVVRFRKGSRGYTHEEIIIHIRRVLSKNTCKGSRLVLPYGILLGREKERREKKG